MKYAVYVSALALLATSACSSDTPPPPRPVHVERPGKPIPTFDTSLEVQDQNGVTFVTGGIGDDERAELEAAKKDFNLHVTSATKNGHFVEYTMVKIVDAKGDSVIETEAGPLLYAQLPAGRYSLVATNQEQQLKRNFTVGKKSADVNLLWNIPATSAY